MLGSITFPIQTVGFVIIKVLDLIQSVEDNITIDEKLTYSFYKDRDAIDTIVHCFDFVLTNNFDTIRLDLNVWVNDEAGNSNHCIVRVNVIDHMDICGIDEPAGQIKGNVTSTSNEYTDAVLNLFDEKYGQIKQTVGPKFEFKDLNWRHNYRLVPTRDDDHVNGISTQDVILIRKYILGHVPLTPYQILAADVNNTRNITMADITEIRKLILGVQEKFSKCKSFRFFTNELEISFPRIPWEATGEVFIEFDVFNWVYNIDFTAIKMGDVTGDARMSNLNDHVKPRISQDLIISALPFMDLNENLISYPVTSSQFIQMQALQLGFAFDPQLDFVNVQSGLLNINDENLGTALLHKSIIRISWDELDAIECHPNDVLFTLHFNKKLTSDHISSLKLENSNMINEAYSLDGEVFSLKIKNSELLNESAQFIVSPNPINDHLFIQSKRSINEQVNLKLFDVQGREILSQDFKSLSGSNRVQLDGFSYNGIMIARLTHAGKTDQFKLIRQER